MIAKWKLYLDRTHFADIINHIQKIVRNLIVKKSHNITLNTIKHVKYIIYCITQCLKQSKSSGKHQCYIYNLQVKYTALSHKSQPDTHNKKKTDISSPKLVSLQAAVVLASLTMATWTKQEISLLPLCLNCQHSGYIHSAVIFFSLSQ